jgi:hypothetical protein
MKHIAETIVTEAFAAQTAILEQERLEYTSPTISALKKENDRALLHGLSRSLIDMHRNPPKPTPRLLVAQAIARDVLAEINTIHEQERLEYPAPTSPSQKKNDDLALGAVLAQSLMDDKVYMARTLYDLDLLHLSHMFNT